MFRSIQDRLFAVAVPHICACCEELLAPVRNGNACDQCWEKTQIFDGTEALCARCGLPLSEPSQGISCWQCDGHRYDTARAIGVYDHALSAAVVGLKTTPKLPDLVADLLAETFYRNHLDNADVIIPVPLSKQRRLERGFNQAEVIGATLSKATGIENDSHSLARVHHSPIHRVGMDEKARDLSVKNAFEVLRLKLIEGKSVLLVDDVVTTGATVSYCAKALKKSGAVAVNVLTLARAVSRETYGVSYLGTG